MGASNGFLPQIPEYRETQELEVRLDSGAVVIRSPEQLIALPQGLTLPLESFLPPPTKG